MKREDVIQLARECGAATDVLNHGRWDGVLFTPLELETLIRLATEKAVAEEQERAISLVEDNEMNNRFGQRSRYRFHLVAAIRARKDNT